MIGEQQTPRFAIVHGDTDVPLIDAKRDAVALIGGLHAAILKCSPTARKASQLAARRDDMFCVHTCAGKPRPDCNSVIE